MTKRELIYKTEELMHNTKGCLYTYVNKRLGFTLSKSIRVIDAIADLNFKYLLSATNIYDLKIIYAYVLNNQIKLTINY